MREIQDKIDQYIIDRNYIRQADTNSNWVVDKYMNEQCPTGYYWTRYGPKRLDGHFAKIPSMWSGPVIDWSGFNR